MIPTFQLTKQLPSFLNKAVIPTQVKAASVSTSALKTGGLDQKQVGYLNEECILVDEEDRVVGSASKAALHRAFSVFLFDTKKRLILQKRSEQKITFPQVWTNSCCSHPLNVENELDTSSGIKNAAIRKLDHELNISGLNPDQLELAGRFLYKADSNDQWMEHELDYVFLVRNFKLPIKANPEEVESITRVNRQKLDEMFAKNQFSPWFHLMYKSDWLNKWWQAIDSDLPVKYDGQIHKLN
ncbi:Isopentenyl-diphosphate Delta-isomerase [Aphelenchoides bicaudatus]|nr:Isopentenyl-diphosphate Delta-isomerase [Aphelenchoides bicaudatus]